MKVINLTGNGSAYCMLENTEKDYKLVNVIIDYDSNPYDERGKYREDSIQQQGGGDYVLYLSNALATTSTIYGYAVFMRT